MATRRLNRIQELPQNLANKLSQRSINTAKVRLACPTLHAELHTALGSADGSNPRRRICWRHLPLTSPKSSTSPWRRLRRLLGMQQTVTCQFFSHHMRAGLAAAQVTRAGLALTLDALCSPQDRQQEHLPAANDRRRALREAGCRSAPPRDDPGPSGRGTSRRAVCRPLAQLAAIPWGRRWPFLAAPLRRAAPSKRPDGRRRSLAPAGGIPVGGITELVGPAGVGKTQFCKQARARSPVCETLACFPPRCANVRSAPARFSDGLLLCPACAVTGRTSRLVSFLQLTICATLPVLQGGLGGAPSQSCRAAAERLSARTNLRTVASSNPP